MSFSFSVKLLKRFQIGEFRSQFLVGERFADVDTLLMMGSSASSLSIVAAIVSRSASFCARWRSSEASLARYSSVCLSQELPLHGDEIRARTRRRLKRSFRIVAVAQRRAQSRNVQLRGDKVALDMLLLRLRHGRIELDQHITRFDALAIANVEWRAQRRSRRAGSA